jgi:photosystem II stability/assembly factor-like uncharacterized protein
MFVLRRWRRGALVGGALIPLVLLLAAVPGSASPRRAAPAGLRYRVQAAPNDEPHEAGESGEILAAAQMRAAIRTAPATAVSSAAFRAALAQARALGQVGDAWQEVTSVPYNSDAVNYRDPVWSNSSGGAGLVSGRATGIAFDRGAVYLATADGGVWKTTNRGRSWRPVFDRQVKLSIGAIAVNPADHSIWVGTGEANTNFEAYNGAGIYRSADGGASWRLVGNRLDQSLVSRLTFDGAGGVYAATGRGLLKRRASDLTSRWRVVLKPDPNPTNSPYRTSFMTDVRVRPGTHGSVVLAALAWRGGTLPTDTQYNGFYLSTDRGAHWTRLTLTGDLAGATDVGRTTFAFSSAGDRLYAVVESTDTVALKGVYRSTTGDPVGPWQLVADSDKLASSGSALALSGLPPGVQAWYNQDIIVDPNDPSHVFLGLEEVFETADGGDQWSTIGPYWNFPLPCWSFDPAEDTCPGTTHPDQHALGISGGTLWVGNDGGAYRHPVSAVGQVQWSNLNATLRTLQYYYAGIGRVAGGDNIWGGMQDNGVSLLKPGADQMVSPFGGDGGDVIIDPNNGNKAVNEYVYLAMARTENGGRSPKGTINSYTDISPSCLDPLQQIPGCDPNPRFIAPFAADIHDIDHWVAGGEFVWDNQGKGWDTTCTPSACDWVNVHDTGGTISAIAASGQVIYAGWCSPGNNACGPGLNGFTSGIDTNYGGSWHTVQSPVLPNRVPTAVTIDPSDPAHVYATYGAFNRRWIPDAGVGHVFESNDGGATWRDRSGNLPDIPVNDVVLWKGKVVVGTDIGVFATSQRRPGAWSRVGSGLPNASADDLVVSPGRDYLLVATHGRGLWKLAS